MRKIIADEIKREASRSKRTGKPSGDYASFF
jgi:hypothetical protein